MIQPIFDKVIAGDAEGVRAQVQASLNDGDKPEQIIEEGLICAMDEVGARMRSGDMFVPEVLVAAQAMKAGLAMIKPLLGEKIMAKGKVVIGTVAGDLHDIGKNLVVMMLEGSGYDVVDLGVDVAADKFLQGVEQHQPDLVGMSALLTTTMQSMEETLRVIKNSCPGAKSIVGGAPISQEFADQIGADGYAPDAAAAVELCHRLMKNS